MFYLEDLPNELFLIIFSYLTKFQLLESFLKLNKRFNNLLSGYIHHINLSSILTKDQLEIFTKNYFPFINNSIHSLTIDNKQIGNYFLENIQSIQLENLVQIKLIDHGIDLQEKFLERFKPNIFKLVISSSHQDIKPYRFLSASLKQIEIDFDNGENAKNYLLNPFDLLSTSILIDVRVSFSKLSEYFNLFTCHLPNHIQKLYVSIFSIDKTDYSQTTIFLPSLTDFQLEICQISFHLIEYLLPGNNNKNLKRLAFIGQTTTINPKLWKILLEKYNSVERFDLHLLNNKSVPLSDVEEWRYEFPKHSTEYDPSDNSFRILSSKFNKLNRISLNECIEGLNHIQYPDEISHLIIRSQYWRSYFDLSLNIQNDFSTRFKHIKRLSTTYRQLEYFLQTKFLNQIEQIDIEFAEKYCHIKSEIAEEFINLKCIYLSSMYDGIHELNLHIILKDILLNKFSKINFLFIDAIQIIDDEQVEMSISQWYSSQLNQPNVIYIQGKSLSIWF